jgi:hypothetical protein
VKLTTPEGSDELEEHLLACVVAKNRLTNRRGFSPLQRVLGYQPLTPLSLISDGDRPPDVSSLSKLEGGDPAMIQSSYLRTAATKAFMELDTSDRIRRSVLSGHRPVKNLHVGQLA